MEESKKIKSLWMVIFSLIALNVCVLGRVMFAQLLHQPMGPPPPPEIVRRLDFDENQKKEFEIAKKKHFNSVFQIRENIRAIKKEMFEMIKNDNINDSLLHLETKLLAKQIEMNEFETMNHLADIRKIANAEQKQIFDNEILPLFYRQEHDKNGDKLK
jgi:hypothetical protein